MPRADKATVGVQIFYHRNEPSGK